MSSLRRAPTTVMSKVLAGLALGRLRPKQAQPAGTLTGRFRDVHAYEIGLLLDLIETLEARITELDGKILDGKIEAHLVTPPSVLPARASCGPAASGNTGFARRQPRSTLIKVAPRHDLSARRNN